LDIGLGPEQILAALNQGTRYEIRRARKLRVACAFARTLDEASDFFGIYSAACARNGVSALPRGAFDELMTRLLADVGRGGLIVSRYENAMVGGIVVLRAGHTLHYVYGGSRDDPAARKLPIAHLLHWQAIEWAHDAGCRHYDFGGYSPTGGGVAAFKRGFGGTLIRFAPQFRRVLRPELYRLCEALRGLKRS
jgi:lipid II:glycine glycyltransferase (peptidoglycan interpeptide bridge formation enzyme)